jgi:hypothetical protein
MRRLAVITVLTGVMTLIAAAPAPAQQLTLTPSSANFPPTPLRTDSAPIRFTLTNGPGALFFEVEVGFAFKTSAQEQSFKQTNTCPQFIGPMESCFIDVVFAPDRPTPVHKSDILFGGGGEGAPRAKLSGDVKSSGGSSGGKKKGCKKKGKKRSAAAAKKKCKKKKK